MRTRKLVKHFIFEEKNRARVVLGTGARLNPGTNRLELAEPYSTDPDIEARTWVTNPTTVKQWLGFEVDATHYVVDLVQVTGLGFRLSDGTDEFWWDGGAWVVNTSNWNTEAEVASNIASFPVTPQQLQVIINLTTTDAGYTPQVKEVRVLWASDIEFQEDYIFRSLVPSLRDNVRPIADYLVELPAAANTIDLANDFPLETPYNLVSIDSVFDHSNDPKHLTDLFQSWDGGSKVITLSSTLPAGTRVWIRFVWEPEVAVTTSQDYSEVEKVPSLVLDDINLVGATQLAKDDWVIDRSTGSGSKVPPPIQGDLEVTLHGITDKQTDQQRLADAVKAYFENHPILTSRGLDERFTLWLVDEYDMSVAKGVSDYYTGRTRFRIRDVLFYVRDAVDIFGVKKLHLVGDMDVTIED